MSHEDGRDGEHPVTGPASGGDPDRRHWARKSLMVARTHLRRVRRQQLGSAWKLVIFGFLALLFGAFTLGGSWLAHTLGEAVAAGDLTIGDRVDTLRGVAATAWLGLTAMITVRAAGNRGARESTGGLLWVAPTRAFAVGLAMAELAVVLLWLGVPALAVTVGFATGLGSPLPLVTVGLALAVVAILSVAVGYPLGVAVRHVLTRYPFVKRYRTPLVVLAAVAYVLAVSAGALGRLIGLLIEPLSLTPPGWVADVALLGVPGASPSPLLAALAVAQVLVVLPAVVATTRVANRHWFADPVLDDEEGGEQATATDRERAGDASEAGAVLATRPRLERWLASVVDRPTAALVVVSYRRAYRAPAKLFYAAMPFFFLLGYVPQVVRGEQIPSFTPVMMLLFVTWGAGVAFVLNPLGDQGSVLPATVLSGVSGRRFVGAHVLASVLLLLPLGVVLTGATAVASPLGTAETVLLLGATPIVVVAGSLAGVGIGMAAPRFSSVRVSGSTRAVVPSKVAFVGYSVYLAGTAVAGLLVAREGARELLAVLVTRLLPISVQPETLLVVAGALLVGLLAAPFAGYRYAVSRFEIVTLESAGG